MSAPKIDIKLPNSGDIVKGFVQHATMGQGLMYAGRDNIDSLIKGVGRVGKDIEKQVGRTASNLAYVVGKGDLNNLGNTLTLGASGGETALERKTRELGDKAAAEQTRLEEDTVAAKERDRLRKIATRLEQGANTRSRQPGMSQLLIGGNQGGALLTTQKGS